MSSMAGTPNWFILAIFAAVTALFSQSTLEFWGNLGDLLVQPNSAKPSVTDLRCGWISGLQLLHRYLVYSGTLSPRSWGSSTPSLNLCYGSLSTLNPIAYLFFNAIEPPVSDHPKCHAIVVTYGKWSLTRAWTILGQNVYSLVNTGAW